MKINQRLVAEKAQVSPATVSRVLRKSTHVSPEVEARVQKAMHELGFIEDNQQFIFGSTANRSVLLIVDTITFKLYSEYVSGACEILLENGLNPVLCNSYGDLETERQYLLRANTEGFAGVIFFTLSQTEDYLNLLKTCVVPIVFVNHKPYIGDYDSVTIDHYYSARLAADFFISHGHTRIAQLTVRLDVSTTRDEARGFTDTLLDKKICTEADVASRIIVGENASIESGIQFAHQFIKKKLPFTGFYFTSSEQAEGFVVELLKQGLTIPKDVSVVSLNSSPILINGSIPITTLEHPSVEMGRNVATLLLERIKHPDKNPHGITYSAKIVDRGSVRQL